MAPDEIEERAAKRFKHQSYNQTLKNVHLPSALAQAQFDDDIEDNDSHFHQALDHWRQLNLSSAFIKFANKTDGLSASMPLLLHHWKEIVDLWLLALDSADDEALKALLDLLQKLAHDIRTTLYPLYEDIVFRLVGFLPRRISAEALTTLLATFSGLFKHVLIPTGDDHLVEKTWNLFKDILPKCNAETQRATAEVWGTALRRFKLSNRSTLVRLIAASATDIQDACAWIFVVSCKSVAQSLHTAATSIYTPLIDHYLACENDVIVFALIRRTLTALIHHVKSAEQFVPVADVIIKHLEGPILDQQKLGRILSLAAVVSSVRRGSRLSQKQLTEIASVYTSIAYTDIIHLNMLKLSTSLLMAGEMPFWMGPGRKMIEHSWSQNSELGIQLSGSLLELNWNGWKMIAAPFVLRNTWSSLEKQPSQMLRLLAKLQKEGKLIDIDAVWKDKMEKWVASRILREDWERSEETVCELQDILTLSSVLPGISKMFGHITKATLEMENSSDDFQRTPANSSIVLRFCLEALATQKKADWPEQLKSTSAIVDMSGHWGWSENVMGGLESFVKASTKQISPTTFAAIYPHLKDSIMSHSQAMRLHILRLLASPAVECLPNEREVVRRCLQGEEVSLDVQGVRERVLRIGRICQAVPDGDRSAADLAGRWLLVQLKVNLRPLWSAAMSALLTLSERFGDLVWNLVFFDLQRMCESDVELEALTPNWMQNCLEEVEGDDIQEVERTWRDPSAHKMRVAVIKWTSEDSSRRDLVRVQTPADRFDPASYEAQLLGLLGECSSLAEKHNRELVPMFLSFVDPESPSKYARRKLSLWLTLFSKFTNPKALHSTEKLQQLYTTLLSHPDRSLQKLALASILTYKSPHLLPYKDTLDALLDDTRWRDELTGLDISGIEDKDRAVYVYVLARLLFGVMLEKRGRSRGGDRRSTIISAFGGCRDDELQILVDLMLAPFRKHISSRTGTEFRICTISPELSEKQQIGYLNLLEDVLKNLGPRLVNYWPALLGTTLDLLANAQITIDSRRKVQEPEDDDEVEVEAENIDEDSHENASPSKMIRTVRQLGLKRFAEFFKCPVTFDFSPYLSEVYRAIISPRLPSLDQENTQAPSALLELFHVWTLRPEFAGYLTGFDDRTLPKVYDCLTAVNVKPAVISRIFDIVDGLLALSSTSDTIAKDVVKPHISRLLENLTMLVGRTKEVASVSNPLGQRQIFMLSELAQYLTDSDQASSLLKLFSPLLRKPPKVVTEKVKADMIKIISDLLPLVPELGNPGSPIHLATFTLLSQLLQSLRARPARVGLILAFHRLASLDPSLLQVAEVLESLNAYSTKRMDEPDFDRRMSAFTKLNEELHTTLSSTQWLPLLYNMLYCIQDPTELAVRSNASLALRSFIDIVAQSDDKQWETTFLKVLYPGLKNGLRSRNEMVRGEVLGVLAHAVTQCQGIATFQEMRVLLADGDEEANFFNNIHHVQVHRRTRALRRLAEYCSEGKLRSSTLADIFVPLVGNYIGTTDSIDHHLVNEAIVTTGRMASCLAWGAYNSLIQQYLRQTKKKDESERVYVRAIVTILDNFHFPMDDTVVDMAPEDVDGEEIDSEEPVEDPAAKKVTAKIVDAVTNRLLPALLLHLEKRDENEDTLRIPIAVGIVNVAKHLPKDSREVQISKLLTVLSQVFRSKSQETRDLTRETLCRIATNIGPSYMPIIMRELRAALLRGPHLHVLAVVTHGLLVHVTSAEHVESFSVLDECVEDVAHVSAEVIFGQSGKDTQAEGFKTKMREVRSSSSKALDSFAIISKYITPLKVSSLLHPVRSILHETETLKTLQQADDVLRRISSGINSNKHIVPSELLSLCHTLISQNARFLQDAPRTKRSRKDKSSAIVQMKRSAPTVSDHYANNSFRFVVFGLDLFVTAHRRSRFDFQDTQIISRLEPMVTVIGNTLYSQNAAVITLGMKAAAAIMKCPLKSVNKTMPVIVAQTIEIIRETGSTESEVVQTAFRSLAAVLRDHPEARVKEKDLVFLLELISPDLEEPSRQASVFTILRAIITRKFVVPEIYDLMDKVSEIMVTNQSSQVQELCRGALLQFLLDYPQGKNRLRNQMTFLAKNLSYVYESGRKSVMELLSALVSKFEPGLVHEYGDLLFVSLVMVIANDESAKCREMAAELIKALYSRLDDKHRKLLLSHLHSWASQVTQSPLTRVSCQVYGLIVDVQQQESESFVDILLPDLGSVLERSAQVLGEDADAAEEMELDADWQAPYQALVVLSKVLTVFPALTTKDGAVDWESVLAHSLYPHAWVRTASCRMLGTLFTAVPPAAPINSPVEDTELPSLFSLAWMEEVAKKLCLQLRSEHLDENLSLQIVKNLFYVGKCFSLVPFALEQLGDEEKSENEEEQGEGEEEPEDVDESTGRHPLRWMFSKLSYQVRSAHIARRNKSSVSHDWSHQPLSVLKWFAAMSTHLEPTVLEQFLVHILSPVYRLIEDDTIRDPRMDELKNTAVELQDLVQTKVGTTKFAQVYNTIRQGVISVRRERKTARVMQVTTHPEMAARRKIQRNVSKKESRKRKDAGFAESKGRMKRKKREY